MSTLDRRSFLESSSAAALVCLQPELLALPPRFAAAVRLGVIGCGRQARALLGELAKFEDVRVAALCDLDESRLRSAERRAQGARTFSDHAALLAEVPELDAVIVATPTHLHRAVAEDCLAAGKHVYCEGPLASTLEDCRALVRAARAAGKVFQVGMQGRSNPVYRLAQSFTRSGTIRDIVAMQAHYRRKDDWRSSSRDPAREKEINWKLDREVSLGLTGEIGTHQFDVMHWFLDAYPTRVRASGAVLAWKDGREEPDTAHCELEFPGGQTLLWEATLGNSFEGQHELLLGTAGAIKLAWSHGWMFREADAPTEGWQVYANKQRFHDDEGITLIADATQLASQGKLAAGVGLPHPSDYYALEAFLKSVAEGAEVVCGVDEGLRAAAVAIRAREALVQGGWVEIAAEDLTVEKR
jgi:predicted dehydrogenase